MMISAQLRAIWDVFVPHGLHDLAQGFVCV
jgi:hypothetical protein